MIIDLLSSELNNTIRLVLVRHGQDTGSTNGGSDRRLSELGKAQAKLTGEFLSQFNFKSCFTSDLLRTAETSEVISSLTENRFQLTYQLREIRPFYAMGEVDLAEEQAGPVLSFINELMNNFENSLVLAVTHCHLIRYIFSLSSIIDVSQTRSVHELYSRGLLKRDGCTIDVANCSISVLEISKEGRLNPKLINFTDHWKGRIQDS